MEDWKEYKLEEVCENIYSGGTPATTSKEFWNGDLPWLSSGETGQNYIYSTEKTITQLGADNSSTRYAYKYSTVVASAGQGYTRGQASFLMIDTYVNQSVIVLKPNPKIIDSRFLYFNIDNRYAELRQLSDGTSTRGSLSGKIMKDLTINLPPLPTQQKIAQILSSLDDKIELNNKINANLEQQAQALFKSWFVDFEPFGGEVSAGWKEKSLYEYADFINGTSFKEDEYGTVGVPIIKIAELKNGITDATQYFNGIKDSKYDVKDGDILFSWSGNPETSIDIFIWTLGNAILNQHTFNVKSNTNRKWFTYCLLKYFKPEFCHRAGCKQTTGLGHVTANDLKQIMFSSDEKSEIDFEKLITPVMEQVYNNKKENQKLASIRDTLLPKLMNGEIEM